MLQIKTTGVEDYLDGSANIKALIIGGPGVGKTRMSSYWPAPLFLDCENGRGSLADRNMPYAVIRSSQDMLDALEYAKSLERSAPKGQRQFQTIVVDTIDSYQRLVKDEWVQKERAATFTGFDAWGYLETKMQQLFTRLLNLDYNVLVLVHYEDKQFKDGEDTVREFVLQLQGKIKDTIYNDFGLVGWLGTYWAASDEGRVQKRGLTFQPTPDKPMLKDRFHVTPKWMEIEFADNDYQQLFEAFFNRPEFENLGESAVVGEIPVAQPNGPSADPAGPVAKPAEGGALPEAPPVEVPLEKKLKDELVDIAKDLDITVKGNWLKGEIIEAIKAEQAKRAAGQDGTVPEDIPEDGPSGLSVDDDDQADEAKEQERSRGFIPQDELREQVDQIKADAVDPTPPKSEGSSPESTPTETAADATNASAEPSAPTDDSSPTSSGDDAAEAQPMDPDEVAEALGATVISEEKTDAPDTQPAPPSTPVATPSVPPGASECADCKKDLTEEWADPSKKDYLRLSKVKFRRYLCTGCFAAAAK